MNGAELRDAVRRATEAGHRAVEAHPVTVRALSPPFRVAAVRSFLEGMRPAWHAIEARRERAEIAGVLAGAVGPPRGPDLDADIIRLGGSPDPEAPGRDDGLDRPAALGGLYVLEGARLGAAVVQRALAGDPELRVLRFFRVDPSAPSLAQFVERAAANLATEAERARFLAGAGGAFAAMLAGLDRAAAR